MLGEVSRCAYRLPPRAFHRFPLGAAEGGEKTVIDRALDSFGFSVPLVELVEVSSMCDNSTEGTADSDPSTPVGMVEHGDTADSDNEKSAGSVVLPANATSTSTRHPKHPFIVTR